MFAGAFLPFLSAILLVLAIQARLMYDEWYYSLGIMSIWGQCSMLAFCLIPYKLHEAWAASVWAKKALEVKKTDFEMTTQDDSDSRDRIINGFSYKANHIYMDSAISHWLYMLSKVVLSLSVIVFGLISAVLGLPVLEKLHARLSSINIPSIPPTTIIIVLLIIIIGILLSRD